jgi:ATP-dependent 26S proteasome regulatory subunit
VILKEARETLDDRQQSAISQAAIGQAPSITFAQVGGVAMKQGMTVRELVEQFQEDMKRPREVFPRV